MASIESETSLTLIVPGLLDGPDGTMPSPGIARALATLLSRADTEAFTASDTMAGIARLAALPPTALEATAALRYLDDTGNIPSGFCLGADPIHLQVGREQIIMGRHRGMEITPEESEALRALLEPDITRRGARLEITRPDHWYVFPATAPEARFASGRDLSGQGIRDHMPSGPDAGPWRALISDAQILLHDCALNTDRANRGAAPVNSLWLWGGGMLQERTTASPPWNTAACDDPVVRGLARLSGCARVSGAPKDYEAWDAKGPGLVVTDSMADRALIADPGDWMQTLTALDEAWFLPITTALAGKALSELLLIPLNGRSYRITPRHLRRWWKRPRPLQHFLTPAR